MRLIDAATDAGATVVATRDYHPFDHVSFTTQGGPFPAHCVQGTKGSKLVPPIATALGRGVRNYGAERTLVAFKALHEDIDSFGGFPYMEGGEGRIARCDSWRSRRTARWAAQRRRGPARSCSRALAAATAGGGNPDDIDMDTPPDVLSLHPDGKDRGRRGGGAQEEEGLRVRPCARFLRPRHLHQRPPVRLRERTHAARRGARGAHRRRRRARLGVSVRPAAGAGEAARRRRQPLVVHKPAAEAPPCVDGCGRQGRAAAGVPRVPRPVWLARACKRR